MKTSELSGAALDWAVAKCNGHMDDETIIRKLEPDEEGWCIAYSTDWAQGGPIIEREQIQLRLHVEVEGYWSANIFVTNEQTIGTTVFEEGPTPLIAAMRCYVASVLGDEVNIPPDII